MDYEADNSNPYLTDIDDYGHPYLVSQDLYADNDTPYTVYQSNFNTDDVYLPNFEPYSPQSIEDISDSENVDIVPERIEDFYFQLRAADLLKFEVEKPNVRYLATRRQRIRRNQWIPSPIQDIQDDQEHSEAKFDEEVLNSFFKNVSGETTLDELVLFISQNNPKVEKISLKLLKKALHRETRHQLQLDPDSDSLYWASRFGSAQLMREGREKSMTLHRLADDFKTLSSHYAETLIYEMGLPEYLRSIQSVKIGGVAGGLKYITCSMLFKLPSDQLLKKDHFLYGGKGKKGSDEYAMKAAARELHAANEFCNDLPERYSVPMQCIVDFLGYRIISMPVLPINNDTIVYGSNDARKTVKWDADVHDVMKKTAHRLHLAEHPVKGKDNIVRKLWTAGDVEVHKGTDQFHYVLDLPRLFPPLDPCECSKAAGLPFHVNAVFFRLLRPEFLQTLSSEKNIGIEPISSDAFSGWGDIDSEIFNEIATEATAELIYANIPKLIRKLDTLNQKKDIRTINLAEVFHRYGINMVFLGYVFSMCNDQVAKWVLAREMVCRILKNTLRRKLRRIRKDKSDWISPFSTKISLANFLTSICSISSNNLDLEDISIRMIKYFGRGAQECGNVKEIFRLDPVGIVLRILKDCGVVITDTCRREFSNIGIGFIFSTSDFEAFDSHTASLTLLETSHSETLYERSADLVEAPHNQFRHIHMAAESWKEGTDKQESTEKNLVLSSFSLQTEDLESYFFTETAKRMMITACLRRAVYGVSSVLEIPKSVFTWVLEYWDDQMYIQVAEVLATCSSYLEDHKGSWDAILDQVTADRLVDCCYNTLNEIFFETSNYVSFDEAASFLLCSTAFIDGFMSSTVRIMFAEFLERLRNSEWNHELSNIISMIQFRCSGFYEKNQWANVEGNITTLGDLSIFSKLSPVLEIDASVKNFGPIPSRLSRNQEYPAGLFHCTLVVYVLRCEMLVDAMTSENWNIAYSLLSRLHSVNMAWESREHDNIFDQLFDEIGFEDKLLLTATNAVKEGFQESMREIAQNCARTGQVDGRLNCFVEPGALFESMKNVFNDKVFFQRFLPLLSDYEVDKVMLAKRLQAFLSGTDVELLEPLNYFIKNVDFNLDLKEPEDLDFHYDDFFDLTKYLIDLDHNVIRIGFEKTLIEACLTGKKDMIYLLMECGISPECSSVINKEELLPLHAASENDHRDIVVFLLEYGTDPSKAAHNGFAAIHSACRRGHIELVKLLIEHDANYEAITESNMNSLHYACISGSIELVEFLISLGLDVNTTAADGTTPFYLACREDNTELARLLLENNCNPVSMGPNNVRPLHEACRHGMKDIVVDIVRGGENINAKDAHNMTALRYACKNGFQELALLLLDMGANAPLKTDVDHDPLMEDIVSGGHTEILSALIESGFATDGSFNMELFLCACRNGSNGTVCLLLSREFDMQDAIHNHGALHLACRSGSVSVVRKLLDNGAFIHTYSKALGTPLHQACQSGSVELVQFLIDCGSDIHYKAGILGIPLHQACRAGSKAIVKLLIDSGCDVNALTEKLGSALHFACARGSLEVVKYLVSSGADLNLVDAMGNTAIAIAEIRNFKDIVGYLDSLS